MINGRLKITFIMLTIIMFTLNQLVTLLQFEINAQNQVFTIQNYSYKSSADTKLIYPGSRNVVIKVSITYNGSTPIIISAGCINLPQGFSISRGYSSCSPPETANGSTYSIVMPGDVITFTYRIDVDSGTKPSTYEANITIHYRSQGSNTPLTAIVTGVLITVSPYPPIKIAVVDWYWSPDAYPGSEGIYLYLTLRNIGNSTVYQAVGKISLPQYVFFYTQQASRFIVSNIGKNQTTTISIGPISVYPNAMSNVPYQAIISMNATMYTDDNVVYYTQGNVAFYISISPAPSVNIYIVDYGIESPKPVQGVKQTRFYIVVRNMDFKNIISITAYFTIDSPGATFVNASKTSVTLWQQILGYGDTATIYSDPIMVDNIEYLTISVKLVIFGDNNNAEFWSEQRYYFTVKLYASAIDIRVVNVYWSSSEVYPGSERTTLNIVLLNNDVVDFRSGTATLDLPKGFYPQQVSISGVSITRGTTAQVSFSGISINTSVTPGEYVAKLTLNGVVYDPSTGSFYTVTLTYTVSVKVFEKPVKNILALVSYGWIGDRVYITSIKASTYLYLQVASPGYTVSNPRITVYLPNQMIYEDGNRNRTICVSGDYGYGQYIRAEVEGIDIVTVESDFYPIVVKVEGLARTPSEYWFTQYFTILMRIDRPILNISIIDFGWINNPVALNASGASLYLTLQSFSIDTVSSIVAKVKLVGAKFLNNLDEAVQTITTPINYGEIQTLRLSDIEVSNKIINVTVTFSAVLIVGRNTYYRASKETSFTLLTVESLNIFRVASLHTLFRGAYAPLLPSARGITISIELVNTKSIQIAWIKTDVKVRSNLKINDVGGTCINGVAAGGTCRIDLNVDVPSNATPSIASIDLYLTYAVRSGSTLSPFMENLRVEVPIASYRYYRPVIAIASTYWGSAQTPARVLVNQRNAGFTVVVANLGYYSVEGVVVEAIPINNTITMIKSSDTCSPQLSPGAFCSVTLYTDLGSVSRGGVALFKVIVEYVFTQYSVNIVDSEMFIVSLPIEEPASGKGLELVDVSWANNWPVYPNTENATLVITMANRWSYRISGIDLELILPQGFNSKEGSKAKTYIPGPEGSLQQFNIQFTLSVGNITPGRYTAKLIARYVVETGLPNTAVQEEYNVTLIVNDLSKSVEVVNVYWVGRSPQPPEYGTMLMVIVRNNFNPSMKGVLMDVGLPPGIVYADTNTSRAKVPAVATNILQQIQVARVPLPQLPELVSSLLAQQTQVQQGFSYGDLMYFYLKLNIVTSRTGLFRFNTTLNFIDHWNNVRVIPLTFEITILGSTKIVDIVAPTSIAVKRGIANTTIGLMNRGSAPLYNVYVYLVPYAAMLIPQQAVKYIDTLKPYEIVNISYTMVYNPFAISMGTTQTYLRYMSVPFALSIIYRDANGNLQVFNTSLAFILEPFIEIVLLDAKASVSTGSVIAVSGTIANYGIATARSVVAKVLYSGFEGETLVGDVDPASQSSFRVELKVNNILSDNVLLQLIYRDEYGRINSVNYTLQLITIRTETTTQSQQPSSIQYNHYIVIGLVTAFLAAVSITLYWYAKKHAKAIEKAVTESSQV
jgi:hypothetical protein